MFPNLMSHTGDCTWESAIPWNWNLGSIHDAEYRQVRFLGKQYHIAERQLAAAPRQAEIVVPFPGKRRSSEAEVESHDSHARPRGDRLNLQTGFIEHTTKLNSCLRDNYEHGVYMNFPNGTVQSVHSFSLERYIKHINWSTFTDLNISQHCQAVNIGMSVPVAQHSGFRSFQLHPSAANRVTDICLCLTASTALSGGSKCWIACPTGEDIQMPENTLAQ